MTATKEVEEKHSSILRRVIQWVWVLLNLVVSEFLVPIGWPASAAEPVAKGRLQTTFARGGG